MNIYVLNSQNIPGGEKMEILGIIGKTFLAYIFLIIVIRFMGKREVGNLSIFDLAVYFTISDLVTMSIVDKRNELWLPAVSVAFLALMQIVLSKISMKSKKIRDLIDGKMSLIINNGNLDFEEMKKQRYTIDDLFSQLRDKGYDSPMDIRWAILETSGKLSVISKEQSQTNYPDPLIMDGKIEKETLKACNKTEQWLYQKLSQQNIQVNEVHLALLLNQDRLIIFK